MLTQYQKLKEILREMFQMDQADLDFGIYRIMNAKRAEIEKFLDDELLPQVKEEFAKYRGTEIEDKKKELTALEKTIEDSGMNPDESPKVKALREEIAKYGDDDALANEVFSHLSSFFRRYYDNGDFLSLRRYKKDTYAIPYEGEEVKLYWANADQYYIKTSAYLRDYTFRLLGGKRAHFKLVDATQEKDNTKGDADKERKFRLFSDEPIRVEGNELFIQFVYLPDKDKQDGLNKRTIEYLKAEFGKALKGFDEIFAVSPTEKNPKRTLVEKHLASYTARFNFDFFIHKDLGGFLTRELDFYVKNEVLFVDDLDGQDERKLKNAVARVKVIKHIARKIIAFLAQLENFQQKLWLKKKFVVSCDYCITLDKVQPSLYTEIVGNDAQREEWVELFGINEILGDLAKPAYSKPLTVEFLKANPSLVLDTKHFNEQFKQRLIASFDNLDGAVDGVIINSENFQALNLMLEKYREQIRCVYIDPPFNLGENPDYLYKVDYKDSSWLSLLSDRISVAKALFHNEGSIFVRCNHDGNMILRLMLNDVMGTENYRNEIILRRAEETKGDLNKQFAGVKSITVNYDNIYWYSKKSDTRFGRFLKPISAEKGEAHWHSFWKAEDRPNMRYELLGIDLRTHYGQWMWEINRATKAKENYEEYEKISKKTKESLEDYWKRTGESLEFIRREGNGFSSIKYWISPREFVMADNNWLDIKGYSNNWGFKTENSEIVLKRIVESLTKEGDLICDFFLGSGTTAATSHKMKRRWLCVEMGEHFYSVILPRMKHVLFGEQSGISKSVDWKGGGFFKYLSLESYDDTLDNLVAVRTDGQQKTLEKIGRQVREDYMLSYMLNIETKNSDSILNIDHFNDPFNYTLKIRKDNELKDQKVDLVETFNYLIGLCVEQSDMIRGFKVVRGKLRTGEKTLVIWSNRLEKSREDLNEFFRKQKYNTLDFEFDLIFVNGDNNLENLKVAEDKWKVRLIEEEFKKRMFEQVGA